MNINIYFLYRENILKTIPFVLYFILPIIITGCQSKQGFDSCLEYVNPLIGTGGHGHVFVGASVPHGMVQLGPNNVTKGWDWCSAYHASDSTIIGFAHTHLSGTGIADLGDISFMPVNYPVELNKSDYATTFLKSNQTVKPGYYSVLLDKSQIQVELTASERVGFHRYVYPEKSIKSVVIDLLEAPKSLEARAGVLESSLTLLNDSVVCGFRVSNEWAHNHKVFFATKFSQPIAELYVEEDGLAKELSDKKVVSGKKIKALLSFDSTNAELLVKTGISYVSEENALENLQTEINHWDFEKIKDNASQKWVEALSTIDFYSSDDSVMTIFYTALYHTKISPMLFADVNGEYLGADGVVRKSEGFTPYTVFSLWDTYRAVHPLYNLIEENNSDYINTLLAIAEQQGALPVWHLVGEETSCMVGVHSASVIAEGLCKQIPGVNQERALRLLLTFSDRKDRGLDYHNEKGYIPADREEWSVAKGLEYAINDYAIAFAANHMNDEGNAKLHHERSKNYRHYFDSISGFMRGKLNDGSWRDRFNPFHSIHLEDDYVEGNAWQYTWLVPHDVEGLIALFGGEKAFADKLDSLFLVSSELNEGASIDITGMIGQYAHGNEPSHHTLYLYPYVGQQWKTAEKVRDVYANFYKASEDGLIGNEDCGQMSTWYVFSALGFYPVNPVDGIYVFGSPLAKSATLKLNNGNLFRIEVENYSNNNQYIESIKLNDKTYDKSYITHRDIMNGGVIVYTMTDQPNKKFGLSEDNRPYSILNHTFKLTN